MALKWVTELLMILFIYSLFYNIPLLMSASRVSIEEDYNLELERQLKILNKPPIKTFQTKEGDIIDCVDINKQPALDHPLLKNHNVQTKPTALPKKLEETLSRKAKAPQRIRYAREACPAATVPIRRTHKEDLLRMKSLTKGPLINFGQQDSSTPKDPSRKQAVHVRTMEGPNYYYGAYGRASTYNLSVNDQQFSGANLWIHTGPSDSPTYIVAGWAVSSKLNNDTLTRLFTYWWGGSSGCYNTYCPGFVSTNPNVSPDYPLLPTSTYGGEQHDILLLVFQDRATGNWWFAMSDNLTIVGYWPKELLPALSNGASHVAWGGSADADTQGNFPPMGSGHFPDNDYTRSCFFSKIQFVNDNNELQIPDDDATIRTKDNGCYGVVDRKDCGDYKKMHYCFTFGGPGGIC